MTDLPFTLDEIAALAGRGMGKVDLWGHRGATLVSAEETVAMAAALALLGLRPIPPGTAPPAPLDHPPTPLKGPADV
jgi:hypothetical protein